MTSDIFYIRDKESFVKWVKYSQNDLTIKAFKTNRNTYHHLIPEMVDVITLTSCIKDSKMFAAYLMSVPVYFDDSIDDYVVKAERKE